MSRHDWDHIDPDYPEGCDRPYQMVCGLTNSFNLVERDKSANISKSNRFLPWRVAKDELGQDPIEFGDLCQFLDRETGEWVLEEFMGNWYKEQTKDLCGQSIAGQRTYEKGTGFWSFTKEQRSKVCQKGANSQSREDKSLAGKKGAKAQIDAGIGIFNFTPQQKSERGKKGAAATPKGTHRKGGLDAGNVKFMCLKTGHISTAPGLAHYQRAKGIDTSYRVRLTAEEMAFIFLWA
jgi:general stress protein YciG